MGQLTNTEIKGVKKEIFFKTLVIGFFGGVIWSSITVLLYAFKMIDINPMMIFQAVFGDKSWLAKWYMYVLLIIVIGVISIGIAMIYYFILKRFKSWLVGGMYGVLIWSILILLLPLIINGLSGLNAYNSQTYIGTFCVLLLYGIFVGYSISFEYQYAIKERQKN